jgi:hypothetical protein
MAAPKPRYPPAESAWTLRRILDESPPPRVVRKFMRANCGAIENDDEEGRFKEFLIDEPTH